jgi:pimeloyl-ACP methyl ester carboxylesterase
VNFAIGGRMLRLSDIARVHRGYADPPQPQFRVSALRCSLSTATWEATIKTSVEVGYRVIAPDQIGFCKSTKPERHQYSF